MHSILIAPAAFKGTLSAKKAATVIEGVLREQRKSDEITLDICPLADGGDDTLVVLLENDSGYESHQVTVAGPLLGQSVQTKWIKHSQKKMIIVEAAQAHGMARLPNNKLDALNTTSYGVGEIILAALNSLKDPTDWTVVVTLGGSASTDGGAGALQALGYEFIDEQAESIQVPITGAQVSNIRAVSEAALPPVKFIIATDVINPLLGQDGAAYIFSPQKGAEWEDVLTLEINLTNFATLMKQATEKDLSPTPGAGAAGGLGFGLAHLPGASLVSGSQWISEALDIPNRIAKSDLIITGEGRFDRQSMSGKGTGYILSLALSPKLQKPCVVFCGRQEKGMVIDKLVSVFPMVSTEVDPEEAIARPQQTLRNTVLAALPNLKLDPEP
ncbi:MAG: glycerate kinase [Vampirovibrio sp.]|nr:glycerate kinase [Vampirovibrio sp.]